MRVGERVGKRVAGGGGIMAKVRRGVRLRRRARGEAEEMVGWAEGCVVVRQGSIVLIETLIKIFDLK